MVRFNEAFWDHFKNDGSDFSNIWFPVGFGFFKETFTKPADFTNSHFHGEVDFRETKFLEDVRFNDAVFQGRADFSKSRFEGRANFGNVGFMGEADFQRASFLDSLVLRNGYFEGQARFSGAEFRDLNCQGRRFENRVHLDATRFSGTANFANTSFDGDLFFSGATLDGTLYLTRAELKWDAKFTDCTFNGVTVFRETEFHRDAILANCRFNDRAVFTRTRFFNEADFSYSEFNEASFDNVSFEGPASFEHCDFMGPTFLEGVRLEDGVRFSGSAFRDRALLTGSGEVPFIFEGTEVDFEGVQLDPGVIFNIRMADLRNCRFTDTDLRRIEFSTVKWPLVEMSWYRIPYKRSGIYDELLLSPEESQSEAGRAKAKKVEHLYRALKQNYEERRDYPTAGEFHIGEKEMQRRTTVSWSKRTLLGIYRAVSLYGERAMPSFIMLIAAIVLFAAVYALMGVQLPSSGTAMYLLETPLASLWHGILYSVQVTAFSRPEEYELLRSGGVIISILQRAVTTTLIALFALAIRQQLKR